MSLVAHGGVAGAVIEFVLVAGVAAVFLAVWLRERRAGDDDEEDRSES
jgi:hypothetical protein